MDIKLDLSNVSAEAFIAKLPKLDKERIELLVAEVEAVTKSNIDTAAKWNSFLTLLHTALVVASKTA